LRGWAVSSSWPKIWGWHHPQAKRRPDRPWLRGVDYPRSYREFVEWFPDAAACSAYLERLRWPDGFVCPACRSAAAPWRQTRGRLVCRLCRRQMTVTVVTILDKSEHR